MTPAEYYTYQFYTWEFRGRGWYLAETPVHLEPPFVPFFRHGHDSTYQDDGRKHTFFSRLFENIKGKKRQLTFEEHTLDYSNIEPFIYDAAPDLDAIQIKIPKERKITPEKMKAFLGMLSTCNEIISFEIIADACGITIQFVSDASELQVIETHLDAYFPQCTVLFSDWYVENILINDLRTTVVDFGLKEEFVRPIHTKKNFTIDPLTGVLAVLEHIQDDERAGIQILFQGAVNDWRESILESVTIPGGKSFFADEPLAPKIALEKVQSSLFGVAIRAFSQAPSQRASDTITERLTLALANGSKGTSNQLVPLLSTKYGFERRVDDICLRQSHRLGMILNADELITLLHFPSESIVSKKLFADTRKTRETPPIAVHKPFVLGENYCNGIHSTVTFGIEERVKHTHIIGATGTGKSTLLINLVLQDIKNNIGVIVFDPHGDLIDDIIFRIPENRIYDVVLIDPSDTEYPIGLNILEAHSEIERELLSSDLVASFRKYATTWGDQMSAVFGNAIQALLEHPGGGTIHDLRRFLIEKEFRHTFLQHVSDPTVLYYWQKEFPLLKTNSIGPILTRLDTFLRPRNIRNMIIQSKGLDFDMLLDTNKIVLCKLSQGLLGKENSFLLGSLLLSKIHQAIFRRQQKTKRSPLFLYLDEFHNFITPSIKEMLSGVRKYNVGLILAHQDLQQLQHADTELLNSVVTNTYNRIVFRVGEPDAKNLQEGFMHFDFSDLQNLGIGEAIIRIEQPQFDCSLDTFPLEDISKENENKKLKLITANTRANFATPRENVEMQLHQSLFPLRSVNEEERSDLHENIQVPAETFSKEVLHEIPTDYSVLRTEHKTQTELSRHRYLQTLVKKIAESKGYIAILEQQLPEGRGQVDVLLTKGRKTIAVEICVTTNVEWETHNIAKCIKAKYDTVISICGDTNQLEKIKQSCVKEIENFEEQYVQFFTPESLISFFETSTQVNSLQTEKIMKGFRVNVSYDVAAKEENQINKSAIARIILSSLNKRK